MHFFRKYPAGLVAIFWLGGLYAGLYIPFPEIHLLEVAFFLVVTASGCHFFCKRRTGTANFSIAVTLIAVFLTGAAYVKIRAPERHYKKVTASLPSPVLQVQFIPMHQLKSTSYYRQYVGRVQAINFRPVKPDFHILIKIPLDSSLFLDFQKVYLYNPAPGEWQSLPERRLPYGFDYAAYLQRNNIYRILKIRHPAAMTEQISHRQKSLADLRRKIRENMRKDAGDTRHFQLLAALLLGERQWLDAGLKQAFIDAGVMHILAISGLHIGILLLFLRFLFAAFKRYKWLYNLLILGVLWFYAALIGFPPSVVRAVLMFSLLQVAWELERDLSSAYLLLLAAFLIGTVSPASLHETGFLLSFAAVASILAFYPFFKKLFYPRHPVLRYFMDLFYVSLAAQTGLIPLLLLFFHRFSLGFLLANLIVIPLTGLVLISGFLLMPFWAAGISVKPVVMLLNRLMSLITEIIFHISHYKTFIWENLYFSPFLALASGIFIAGLYDILRKFQWKRSLLYVWLASVFIVAEYISRERRQSAILSSYRGIPYIQLTEGSRIHLYGGNLPVTEYAKLISPYQKIRSIRHDTFPHLFKVNHTTYALLTEAMPDSLFSGKADVLILSRSPKVNLDLWLNRTGARKIIVMPENYAYLKYLWYKTATQRGIKYVDLSNGGYVDLQKTP